MLRVSTMTVRRMARNGEIPNAIKTKGGHFRFSPSPEFEHWRKTSLRQVGIESRALQRARREQMARIDDLSEDCEQQATAYVLAQTPEQVASRVRERLKVGGSARRSNENLHSDAREAVNHALRIFARCYPLMEDSFKRAEYFEPCSNWPAHMSGLFLKFLGPLELIALKTREGYAGKANVWTAKRQVTLEVGLGIRPLKIVRASGRNRRGSLRAPHRHDVHQ